MQQNRPTTVRCHVSWCVEQGHFVGSFQTPFCKRHFELLTPLKQSQVLTIQGFSVLAPDSRMRAHAIINQCRNYLAGKEERRSA